MKLIQQSVADFTQTKFDLISIYKQIEKCARITYKSEDKITDTSYDKFVHNLVKLNHDRPLEFGTVHLKMTAYNWNNLIDDLISFGEFNQIWIKAVQDPKYLDMYITTNYRYYLHIINLGINVSQYFIDENNELFPKRHTIKFITNRAIMDEIRTHVGLSHLAESTRWIDYSKDKFGNELTFVQPTYVDMGLSSDSNSREWFYDMSFCEDTYKELLKEGWKPQQARDVLPLSIKSELVSCGFEDAWQNFVYRRSDKAAHPMVRELSNKVNQLLFNK